MVGEKMSFICWTIAPRDSQDLTSLEARPLKHSGVVVVHQRVDNFWYKHDHSYNVVGTVARVSALLRYALCWESTCHLNLVRPHWNNHLYPTYMSYFLDQGPDLIIIGSYEWLVIPNVCLFPQDTGPPYLRKKMKYMSSESWVLSESVHLPRQTEWLGLKLGRWALS